MHNTYACERSSGQQHALKREYLLVARSVGTLFTPGYYAGHVGNHTRQLKVICDLESSSPHPKAGWDWEKHVPVWRKVSTLA